jgi:hypothetical protein
MDSSDPKRRPPAVLANGLMVGLCADCRHGVLTRTRRGSEFVRCARAAWDPRMRKHPALPVLACVGHEPIEPEE